MCIRDSQCTYDTGCGTIILGVSGSRIAADLDEQGGTLEFHYSLDVNTAQMCIRDSQYTVQVQLHGASLLFFGEIPAAFRGRRPLG